MTTRRVAGVAVSYVLTIFLLLTLNFFLPRAVPGDPVEAMFASGGPLSRPGDEETKAALTRYYGLDQPVLSQYGRYLGGLVTGDLGTSIRYRAPVASVVAARLPWTLLLVVTAVAVATVLGVLAGVQSGWKRGGHLDRSLLAGFVSLRMMPPFFLGSLVLLLFAIKLGWFPVGGAVTPFSGSSAVPSRIADIVRHLVLPAGVLAAHYTGGQYLLMRAGVVSQLGSDYVLLGRAKGVSERALKYRYVARNALLPVTNSTAALLSMAVAATVFAERIFAYPGIGALLVDGVRYHDYPLLQGCFLLLTVSVVSLNFLADLLHARLDPRTTA